VAARKSVRKESAAAPAKHESEGPERLQKVLAAAGVGSRRECEELIVEGRVEVDRQVVSELGTRVDPTSQQIRVDGTMLPRPKREYYLLNKPTGVVCTNRDPSGRARVIDFIRSNERLFPVGRLDRNSEGLILVTNDGELSNKLTHPRYGIEKTYRVRVAGHPTAQLLSKLRRGVRLSDGVARVASIVTKRRYKESTELEIVLNEGRNRELRRILARIGHKVLSLKRIAIGPLRLGDLPVGAHRPLERDEVSRLRDAMDSPQKKSAQLKPNLRKPSKPRAATDFKRPTTNRKPPSTHSASTTQSGDADLSTTTPRAGTVLVLDDESRLRKKRPGPKRATKKQTAKRVSRKKAKTTRKKRR
jgi:23S rRNA pseudouridine2605 synthase